MSEPPITEEQVQELLRRPELRAGAAREFALAHVFASHDECMEAVRWQRTEGRAMVLGGEDPERVREQTEARIAEARKRLHQKLTNLLAWASGPGGGGAQDTPGGAG